MTGSLSFIHSYLSFHNFFPFILIEIELIKINSKTPQNSHRKRINISNMIILFGKLIQMVMISFNSPMMQSGSKKSFCVTFKVNNKILNGCCNLSCCIIYYLFDYFDNSLNIFKTRMKYYLITRTTLIKFNCSLCHFIPLNSISFRFIDLSGSIKKSNSLFDFIK